MARVDLATVIHQCNVAWATVRPHLTCGWTAPPLLSSSWLASGDKKKNKNLVLTSSDQDQNTGSFGFFSFFWSLQSPINPNTQPWRSPNYLQSCLHALMFASVAQVIWNLLSAKKKEIFFCQRCVDGCLSYPPRMNKFHVVPRWRLAFTKHSKMSVVVVTWASVAEAIEDSSPVAKTLIAAN